MRSIFRHTLAIRNPPDRMILGAAGLLLAMALTGGLIEPPLFWLALMTGVAVGVTFLVYRHVTACCVVWLLVTGASLEMTLLDLWSDEMFQGTIVVVKGIEFALAVLCALRFGARLDVYNPAWAYLFMFGTGIAHGFYPGLTAAASLRSLLGSVAPLVFAFCRLPRSWGEAIIRATKWCPLAVVAAAVPLALTGIRPLFVESGGARLGGLGHPAFLANVCLPAIYACLIQLYRGGRHGDVLLLVANFAILSLTGARAPLAYALVVSGLSLVSIRSVIFPPRLRLVLILAAGTAAPIPALLGNLNDIRLFNVIDNAATNLSGRDMLWPEFAAAAELSPWVGWGIGASNMVIPPDGRIDQLLHTRAAHNEYLRIGVEGGEIGRGLLIALFAAWVMVHTRGLCAADRRIMRLAFLALAVHAMTDNVLISTPACVLFAFATAVFTRDGSAAVRLALPPRPGLA